MIFKIARSTEENDLQYIANLIVTNFINHIF